MQISDAVLLREVLNVNEANQLIQEGWRLLAVVPGYDHRNTQAVALYVLGVDEMPLPDA